MTAAHIESAISTVPAGAWAVGVSGGADSVAILAILQSRADLRLHVVHLDHQTRGAESTGDADFVADLSRRWGIACMVARREQIEPLLTDAPANPSAKYRAVRLYLFRRVVEEHHLQGVILAHHADDQAETVFQRLIRGSSYAGLAGMSERTTVGGLTILRPLLKLRRRELREFLIEQGLRWREDASNESDQYLRNRLRRLLGESEELSAALITLSSACVDLRDWSRASAPLLGERICAAELARLPKILADESARKWLVDRGIPIKQIDSAAVDRILLMAIDAASPARLDFPGKRTVRRRAGIIFIDPP